MADEGDLGRDERLARLDAWEWALEEAYRGRPTEPIFVALADTAARFAIPSTPFKRLLQAFRRDVDFRAFPTFGALRAYCANSADPVGHLILYFFGHRDERRQAADRICTGLQLANFWQDVSVDARKGRVYVPPRRLHAHFGLTADDLAWPDAERERPQAAAPTVEHAARAPGSRGWRWPGWSSCGWRELRLFAGGRPGDPEAHRGRRLRRPRPAPEPDQAR
jgi:phytoene/squalene synthetase